MEYVPPKAGAPNAPYVNAAPEQGIAGSIPMAAAIEHPMREIVNAIAAAGLTPDGANLAQLVAAIDALSVTAATNALTPSINSARQVVEVSANDTTPGRLAFKLLQGPGIILSINTPGGNERILIRGNWNGLVNKPVPMPGSEANAGTATVERTIRAVDLRNAIRTHSAFSNVAQSSETPLLFGHQHVFSGFMNFTPLHGLAYIRCVTAQHGFAVNDIVQLPIGGSRALTSTSPVGFTNFGATLSFRNTQAYVRVASGHGIRVLSTVGSWVSVTPANWRLFVRAFG